MPSRHSLFTWLVLTGAPLGAIGAAAAALAAVSYPRLYLAAGVTTMRTAGTEHPEVDLNLKRRIDQGASIGPRLHLTGPYFDGPAGEFLGDTVVRNEQEGRRSQSCSASAIRSAAWPSGGRQISSSSTETRPRTSRI